MKKLTFLFILSIAVMAYQTQAAYNIKPAKPTHYFYTPTAYLNNDFDLVVSLHEAAFTLPNNFQLLFSIVDNVGRICFGVRYGFSDNLSMGGGLAWSFSTLGRGGHGIHKEFDPRLGLFLCWAPVLEDRFEMSLTPHTQIGDHFSLGADLGMMFTPSKYWSIIGELGFSFDLTDMDPYINTIWGARIHPPEIPFMSFDIGIDLMESRPEDFPHHIGPFIDIIFTMQTMR